MTANRRLSASTHPGRSARRSPATPAARRLLVLAVLLSTPMLMGQACGTSFLMNFPMRGDYFDDHDGVYMQTSGHAGEESGTHALDFIARRWNGAKWTRLEEGAVPEPDGTYTNEDFVGFGIPLYAPEDGEILTCFRNMPDGPDPEVNGYDLDPTGKFLAGNHVVIVSKDGGHIMLIAHMQQGSIPPDLCPIEATALRDYDHRCRISGLDGYYNGIRLDELGPLPKVKKGEFIGRMGHSGNSFQPHLHLHVKPLVWDEDGNPCEDHSIPIRFTESWIQQQPQNADVSANGWDRLTRDALPTLGDTGTFAIWPDPIGPRVGDGNLGDASLVNVVADSTGGVVAFADANDELALESFRLQGDGSILLQGSESAGEISELEIAHVDPSTRGVAAVVRDSNGSLKVVGFDVAPSGAMNRGGDWEAGPATYVQATPSPNHAGVVTAMRDSGGQIRVIDFLVNPKNMDVTRPPTTYADAAGNVHSVGGLATIRTGLAADELGGGVAPFEGVVTAEWNADVNGVRVRTWEVGTDGLVELRDFADATSIGGNPAPDVSVVDVSGREVVVLSYRSSGNLRMRTYEVAANGDLTLEDTGSAGAVAAPVIASTARYGEAAVNETITAVKDSNDDLRLVSWSVESDGELRRSGTRRFGFVWDMAAAATSAGMGGNLVVAAETDQNELKLLYLKVNFDQLQ